jgi:hypothetical protein
MNQKQEILLFAYVGQTHRREKTSAASRIRLGKMHQRTVAEKILLLLLS